jgi:hypothetical protein
VNVEEQTASALESALKAHQDGLSIESQLPPQISGAIDLILSQGSAPNRQYLLTIASGTTVNPDSNPASLQIPAGVDRRGQAYAVRDALSDFRNKNGLTLKISQDAGVSNQWREVEITPGWVAGRRKQDRGWASAFMEIVSWLLAVEGPDRQARAEEVLKSAAASIVVLALGSALDYPRFRATPRLAMRLVHDFIAAAPDRPDATEAVVAVAARVLSAVLVNTPSVERRDINSPDPIDVLMKSANGEVSSGIEVTDDHISLGKIEHEVVPAMLKLGLDRATIVSRGVLPNDEAAIEAYLVRAHTHFEQRIDLVTIDVIHSWLNFPGTPRRLPTDLLWGIGEELDQYSNNGNRRAWFDVLTEYAQAIEI